ncbi:putative heterokaryon incompatibility protein 6, OR allele-like [Curvularia clavata]|uniref:Heterokaryon incompatibility protein 6, OR allele-like n=1 Tax=Curvularia clavata TaxID=95742 RepID=A0A9Q9DN40_CURCL|nr:putative heterokaryon incompatibility protein 6, OR allele-like [Curvularia clavata]
METSVLTSSSCGQHLGDLNNQQLRLLDLNFGHDDEIVCLDIQTYKMDEHPPYIALSYTWGDPDDTVPILCNGRVIAVTRNLKEALLHFRKDRKRLVRSTSSTTSCSQPLKFWIDAICINQTNNKEKSFQVGLMAEIYQQAHHVFVWLGPATKSSDLAIRCINTIGTMTEAYGIENAFEGFFEIWREMVFVPGGTQRIVSADPVIQNVDGSRFTVSGKAFQKLFDVVSGWSSQSDLLPIAELKDFFTRSWWTRMWVLQEVTLSRDTHFICGTQRLSKNRCEAFIYMYAALWKILGISFQRDQKSLNQYQRRIIMHLFHHRPTILLSMPRIHHESRFPLAALLRATCVGSINLKRHGPHNLESTKPEDKIFALLGLAADRKELECFGVVPNYDTPYEQTYAITMAALLRQGHISLLSMCQAPRSRGLPSWVPDWSRSVTDMLQDVRNDHITLYPEFNSSGYGIHQPSVKILKDNGVVRRLSIKARLYDDIYEVGRFTKRTNSKEVPLLQTRSWPIRWLLEILRLSYCRKKDYKGFDDRLLASTRSSIGDVGWNENGDFERVGNERLADAVILLRDGLHLVRKAHCKREARRFISSQKETKDRTRNEIQLALEILGKSLGRLPFVTQKGHLGLSSDRIMKGDVIAIIAGSQVPFILRPQDKGQFSVVSEAYVDGIMDGEAVGTSEYGYITLI